MTVLYQFLTNTRGDPLLGLQSSIVLKRANKEVETPITHSRILLQVSSVSDPIGLIATFSVHILKCIRAKTLIQQNRT